LVHEAARGRAIAIAWCGSAGSSSNFASRENRRNFRCSIALDGRSGAGGLSNARDGLPAAVSLGRLAGMRPVATKLLKELRKAKRSAVTDLAVVREAKELQQALEAMDGEVNGLPPNHAAWMHVFKVLAGLAHTLLGTHALRKLSDRVEAADEEYMPSGPPMSPILDWSTTMATKSCWDGDL